MNPLAQGPMPPPLMTLCFGLAAAFAAEPDLTTAPEDTPGAELTIIALSADAEDPVATTTLDADDLREQGAGQELAFALRSTPGVIVWSDAGNGRGYTTMSLRGLCLLYTSDAADE